MILARVHSGCNLTLRLFFPSLILPKHFAHSYYNLWPATGSSGAISIKWDWLRLRPVSVVTIHKHRCIYYHLAPSHTTYYNNTILALLHLYTLTRPHKSTTNLFQSVNKSLNCYITDNIHTTNFSFSFFFNSTIQLLFLLSL